MNAHAHTCCNAHVVTSGHPRHRYVRQLWVTSLVLSNHLWIEILIGCARKGQISNCGSDVAPPGRRTRRVLLLLCLRRRRRRRRGRLQGGIHVHFSVFSDCLISRYPNPRTLISCSSLLHGSCPFDLRGRLGRALRCRLPVRLPSSQLNICALRRRCR